MSSNLIGVATAKDLNPHKDRPMPDQHKTRPFARVATALLLMAALAACSSGGGMLHPGLTARMDAPGASLDRTQAIGIINSYRTTAGAAAVADDATLDAAAQALAAQYAASGTAPAAPVGIVAIRLSAGYPTFAETFSGWRNSAADAAVLASRSATRGGVGFAYNANSNYGVYWVLVLDD
jgi:uncharacterized protein YkwD